MNIRLTKKNRMEDFRNTFGFYWNTSSFESINWFWKKASGLQNRPVNYNQMYPPPFFGTGQDLKKCNCIYSKKAKKKDQKKRTIKKKATKKGKGLLLGPNSPFNQIPLLGALL